MVRLSAIYYLLNDYQNCLRITEELLQKYSSKEEMTCWTGNNKDYDDIPEYLMLLMIWSWHH